MSELREAAKELVRLKDIKERMEAIGIDRHGDSPLADEYMKLASCYEANKDAAWEALRQALTKEVESGWIETTLNGFDWDGTPNGTIIVSFEIPYQEVTTGEAWSLARQSPPQQQGEGRAGLVSEQSSASNESEEVR